MIRANAFFIALVVLQYAASAQTSTARAADAAQEVAARAAGAFEAVDPDTEDARGADTPGIDPAAVYAGLPPLAGAPEAAVPEEEPAPRGPAVRMIPREVVQPLPATAPAAARTPASRPAAARSQGFVVRSILPVEGAFRYGDWYWDDSAAPAAGQLVITVDLQARVISAFRDGHEIGTAVVLVGTQSHPTPLGTFPILTKERNNVSEKYNNAPMPWTLRLTWDGIAIHGSPVMNGYASHGCIGVPDEFAAKLFAEAKRGDKVIITRGKMIGLGDKVL
ncbi:L,D-transpeptidase family protein [Erythrobacter sp. WG]|uniref:L,D-transpeptidase family protein n=1 Tax=Erythrobacter sp. WG TaxID=2985510 RepID=UPI00226E84AD|nr:L,D-transpeptidase family protein [Erythrobacter sp. WG]MCX9147791.1 L,D-transpeptidase family protein [Erythrobacter sp. WG]